VACYATVTRYIHGSHLEGLCYDPDGLSNHQLPAYVQQRFTADLGAGYVHVDGGPLTQVR